MGKRFTIQDVQNVATEKGGRCLSIEYINSYTPLIWQCGKMHPPWQTTFKSVKNQDSWCPTCVRERTAYSIEYARKIAEEKEGKCLSNEYKNNRGLLIWQCKYLHEPWSASLNSIKNGGHWCPKCAILRHSYTLEYVKEIARSKGGVCLSEEYINAKTPLPYQCRYNHPIWYARFDDILDGHWCPRCGYLSYTLSIEEAHKIAAERGGKCLSDTYIGAMEPLLWQCEKSHIWDSPLNSVKNHKSWCPNCRKSHGEELIASLLKIPFNREYSAININISLSGKLRYDFHIPDTKWIIEFDGKQHFSEISYFTNAKPLVERHELDRIKTRGALEAGYSVLRIHYDDFPLINEIIRIVYTKSINTYLCVSRDNVYNFLNMNASTYSSAFHTDTMQSITPKYLTLNVTK